MAGSAISLANWVLSQLSSSLVRSEMATNSVVDAGSNCSGVGGAAAAREKQASTSRAGQQRCVRISILRIMEEYLGGNGGMPTPRWAKSGLAKRLRLPKFPTSAIPPSPPRPCGVATDERGRG